jgi:hypothetical protein
MNYEFGHDGSAYEFLGTIHLHKLQGLLVLFGELRSLRAPLPVKRIL